MLLKDNNFVGQKDLFNVQQNYFLILDAAGDIAVGVYLGDGREALDKGNDVHG